MQRENGTLEPPQLLDVFQEPRTGDYVRLTDGRGVEVTETVREPDGRLRYVIAVDRSTADADRARHEAGVLWTRFKSSLGVQVEVMADAASVILDHGGQLYLWQESVGRAWLRDRTAFADPDTGITFHRIPVGTTSLMLADDVALPKRLRIGVRRLAPGRIQVEWDGLTWGQRGGGDAGGGGG